VLLEDAEDACLQDDSVVDGNHAHLQAQSRGGEQQKEMTGQEAPKILKCQVEADGNHAHLQAQTRGGQAQKEERARCITVCGRA
jgi:hypothetical protein